MMKWLARQLRSVFVDNVQTIDPTLAQILGSGRIKTAAGVSVNEDTALTVPSLFSAINLIANSIAVMGVSVVKTNAVETDTTPNNINPRNTHYLNGVFQSPNFLVTPYHLLQSTIFDMILRGNSYWQIIRSGNYVDQLWLLPAQTVEPYIDKATGVKRYKFFPEGALNGQRYTELEDDEVIHFAAWAYNGLRGKGLLDFARESIGSAVAADKSASETFAGDTIPMGFISHPAKLSGTPAKANIKASVNEQAGNKSVYRTERGEGRGIVILDEGMTFTPLSINPDDAQLLQSRQFTVKEMARWLNIPPFMLGETSTGSGQSAEEQYVQFLTFSLQPWMQRVVEPLERKTLAKADRTSYAITFGKKKILAMTQMNRYDVYNRGRNMGLLTLNDCLREEGLPVIIDKYGDQRLAPSTMKVIGDTDPSTPVQPATISQLVSLASDPNMTETAALVIARLMMPTADEGDLKKLVSEIFRDVVVVQRKSGETNA